jgi:polar amino acid transport system substrate-binding protein
MKLLALLLCITSLPVYSTGNSVDYYVIDRIAEPFQIYDKDQIHRGIVTDIVKELLGPEKMRPVILPFARMVNEMENNPQNKWINYGAKVWGGLQSEVLSKVPIIDVKHIFVAKKNFKYNSIKDLFGKRIVLVRGFQYPGLKKYIDEKKIEILYVDSFKAVLKSIITGRAAVFPGMKIRIIYHMNKNLYSPSQFSTFNAEKIIPSYKIHLSFSESFPKNEIKNIDKKLLDMKKRINFIIDRYLAK